jgi:site-specific DNA-methyltransferase (adenine-specific)
MEELINKVIQADCIEFLKELPDKSVDLVLLDVPYNIGKDKKWDKWKIQLDYINWLGSVFLECERVLKDNGSFYFWHNDFKQMAELQHWINRNTKFVFNSMISWVKPYFRCIAWKNKTENSHLRTYFNIQEYCLYYTFQDMGTGLQKIHDRKDCFVSIKKYLKKEKELSKKTCSDFAKNYKFSARLFLYYFSDIRWLFPTKENYIRMQKVAVGFFQKPYEELRAEYEELRAKFNIQNGEDCHNTWYSSVKNNNGKLHSCQKPQDLLQKIILKSSNENDIVLDCFAGSGSTAVASILLNRRFIGCEIDEKYCNIANARINSIAPQEPQEFLKEEDEKNQLKLL